MTESSTRVAGAIIILIGLLISASFVGLLIGIPMIFIGFVMLIPELFKLILIIAVLLLIKVMI